MSIIHPFKAIRPTRDKAQLVSTRPLAAYRKHILRAKLDENPYTFLHIIHPEGDKEHHSKANSVERFEAVKSRYDSFIEQGILIQDTEESFYIYRQTKGAHQFTGVIAGVSIEEYKDDLIKKHEATITSRESMFTNYLNTTGFNAEPVLLAHTHLPELDKYFDKVTKVRPEYEFSTTDKIKHELWVIDAQKDSKLIAIYANLNQLYIADGHHRSASSARLKDTIIKNKQAQFPNQDYFLAYLIDEQKLEILEFQRLVKHLNGLTPKSFLQACEAHFEIEELKKARKPLQRHEIVCLLGKSAYSFKVKNTISIEKNTVKQLDAQILTDYILSPILGIEDLKTSKDIDFVPGTKDLKKVVDLVKKNDFKVGFLLFPVSINEVKEVADQGGIMPPKSTWVEPKMRSGLTIYNINE
ncbi:DUF1015 domain-containing protein [Fluviicola taffensis]|uniref:Uncharacterized conserved protein UCP033563 n=1 Tax=Fluviicola taffensis (strain DSM 16823 / NCIMB 13979 / RW262) TaxID=755732 RepID=F2IE01_FLUTR|nr:DUF1015 domain-containing protein [Fluviicola taffensis]AEA45565.1 Uncharacterized conserved protein UCP033563 [Fluviicola taffensis DSM 16823]